MWLTNSYHTGPWAFVVDYCSLAPVYPQSEKRAASTAANHKARVGKKVKHTANQAIPSVTPSPRPRI